jgi:hypothetical protein
MQEDDHQQEPTGWPGRAAEQELPGSPDEPSAETLEEENPIESPANDSDEQTANENAASSNEPEQPVAKSTEGLTIGGSEETPTERGDR